MPFRNLTFRGCIFCCLTHAGFVYEIAISGLKLLSSLPAPNSWAVPAHRWQEAQTNALLRLVAHDASRLPPISQRPAPCHLLFRMPPSPCLAFLIPIYTLLRSYARLTIIFFCQHNPACRAVDSRLAKSLRLEELSGWFPFRINFCYFKS